MGLEAESEDRDTNEEHGDDSHPLIIIKLIGDFFFMPYAQPNQDLFHFTVLCVMLVKAKRK